MSSLPQPTPISVGARVCWCAGGGRRTFYGTVTAATAHQLTVRSTHGAELKFRRSRITGGFDCRLVPAETEAILAWKAARPRLTYLRVAFDHDYDGTSIAMVIHPHPGLLSLTLADIPVLRADLDAMEPWLAARPACADRR